MMNTQAKIKYSKKPHSFLKIVTYSFLIIFVINFFSGPTSSFAATKIWTGATDTDWTVGSNWGGTAPLAGDDVLVPGGLSNYPVISTTVTLKTLNINNSGSGATVTLTTGGSLTITGKLTLNAAGTFTMLNGIASINELIISGAINMQGGTITTESDIAVSGTLTQSGGLIWLAINTSTVPNKELIINGGTVNQSGGTITTERYQPASGTFNQTGSSALFKVYRDWRPQSSHTFHSTSGTVQFSGNPSATGSDFSLNPNNQFSSILVDAGIDPEFSKKNNSIVKISGSFTNNNTALDVTTNATFTFNGSGDQTIYSASTPVPDNTTFGNLVIDKPSGTIQMLSDVAVENTFTEENGSLDENGYTLWVAGIPMPVELSSFSAVILESGIQLKWRTETEVNNYGFNILRQSTEGGQDDVWITIGFVDGHGNSNSPKNYSFTDMRALDGKYSYRLKQIDTDGTFEYSKIIEIDLGSVMSYELSQNYPNPFNPSTTIRFSLLESSFINLSIYNSLGEKVEELVNEVKEPGVYTVEFNAETSTGQLASGTYIYRLQANDFTQVKKMILIK